MFTRSSKRPALARVFLIQYAIFDRQVGPLLFLSEKVRNLRVNGILELESAIEKQNADRDGSIRFVGAVNTVEFTQAQQNVNTKRAKEGHMRLFHGLCGSNKQLYKRCAKSMGRPKFRPPLLPHFSTDFNET